MKTLFSHSALLAALILLLALFNNSFAQCSGKTIYLQLPETWGSSIYIYSNSTGAFTSVNSSGKQGNWTVITLPNLSSITTVIFTDINSYANSSGISFINKRSIGKETNLSTLSVNDFLCSSDFGSDGTWIYPDPTDPSKTKVSLEQPNSKTFYLLPPGTSDYIGGIPYIMDMATPTLREPMGVDPNACGWYRKIYFNEPVPENIYIGISINMRKPITGKAIPIASKFAELNSDIIYYRADTDEWLTTRAGIPEESNRCNYNFAAVIYYKGSTGNSFSIYADQSGDAEGVCKGYVKPELKDGKMEWAGKSSCGNYGWANGTDFENAFTFNKENPKNQQLCYDMPFNKRPSGLWEFNSLYLCRDGTVDYSGNCSSGRVGGFYLPDNVFTASGVEKGRTYNGDFGVGPKSCFNKWCYDRGWIGGSCAGMSGGVSSQGEGDLTGLKTEAEINAEMQKYCRRTVGPGDFAGYGDWLGTGDSSPTGVTGLLCFESAPAEFIYEKGQEFFFSGDDDIWVFINNKLVVDLGGTHGPAPGYVKLDTIGVKENKKLTEGEKYPINIFFCDRRGPGSNIRISSNIYFAPAAVNGREPGLFKRTTATSSDEICLQESVTSCAALTGNNNEPICGAELASRLSYKLVVPGHGEIQLDDNNDKCNWLSSTVAICYGGILLNKGAVMIIESSVRASEGESSDLAKYGFELYATVSGYPSLNVSKAEAVTPIKPKTPSLRISSAPQYYNLKGEPLGSKKPAKTGVYIVRQNGASKVVTVK